MCTMSTLCFSVKQFSFFCLTNIIDAQIKHAESLIWHFCVKFGKLYSHRYESTNGHSLLSAHGTRCGPLWTHSTFPFPSFNVQLLKMFHGSQNKAFQIISAVNINRSLPLLSNSLLAGSEEERFYRKLSKKGPLNDGAEIAPNIYALGKPQRKNISANVLQALANFLGSMPDTTKCSFFHRINLVEAFITLLAMIQCPAETVTQSSLKTGLIVKLSVGLIWE